MGVNAGDGTGGSVSSAGDINNDGFDDLLFGVPAVDPDGAVFAGGTYVVFGGVDALDRFGLADATKDGVIHPANLGRNPADYDLRVWRRGTPAGPTQRHCSKPAWRPCSGGDRERRADRGLPAWGNGPFTKQRGGSCAKGMLRPSTGRTRP